MAGRAGGNGQLERLAGWVKWYRFAKRVAHLRDAGSAGRPGYPALVLVKPVPSFAEGALVLQAMSGLSDRELEDALLDRLSFRRFVGLSPDDAVPAHSVLNRFGNRLVSEGIAAKLFAGLDRQLAKAGVLLKRGTMLDRFGPDATLLDPAASARPPVGREDAPTDPEAAFARRGLRGTAGQARLDLWRQAACRGGSGIAADPHGHHHPRQRH